MRYPRETTLSALRNGRNDPTTIIGTDDFWRATLTPHGPATLWLRRVGPDTAVQAFGPGAEWLLAKAPDVCGEHDEPPVLTVTHSVVREAQRRHGDVRLTRSGTPYHELIPAVLGQRVTAAEAVQQWRKLCESYGAPAPGPHPSLRLPPSPETMSRLPYHEFHRFGIERRRAETIRTVARHVDFLTSLADRAIDASTATEQLTRLPGVGVWTAAVAGFVAFGDSDALAVGDFHLKNTVTFALTGRHRGTDEDMVQLLEPYRPHRGRVVRWLALDGWSAPKHGPRRRNLSIARL